MLPVLVRFILATRLLFRAKGEFSTFFPRKESYIKAQVLTMDKEWACILPLSHLSCITVDTFLTTLSFVFFNFFFKIFSSYVCEGM